MTLRIDQSKRRSRKQATKRLCFFATFSVRSFFLLAFSRLFALVWTALKHYFVFTAKKSSDYVIRHVEYYFFEKYFFYSLKKIMAANLQFNGISSHYQIIYVYFTRPYCNWWVGLLRFFILTNHGSCDIELLSGSNLWLIWLQWMWYVLRIKHGL